MVLVMVLVGFSYGFGYSYSYSFSYRFKAWTRDCVKNVFLNTSANKNKLCLFPLLSGDPKLKINKFLRSEFFKNLVKT